MSLQWFRELADADKAGTLTARQLYEWNANHAALYNKTDVALDDLPAVMTDFGVGTIRHAYRTTVNGVDDVLVADVVTASNAAKHTVADLATASVQGLDGNAVGLLTAQRNAQAKDATMFVKLNVEVGTLVAIHPAGVDLPDEAGEVENALARGGPSAQGLGLESTLYRGFDGLVDLPAAMPVIVGTIAEKTLAAHTSVKVLAYVVGGHVQPAPVEIVVPIYARMKVQLAGAGENSRKFIGAILTHALRNGMGPDADDVLVDDDEVGVGGEDSLDTWHASVREDMFSESRANNAYSNAVASPFLFGYASGEDAFTAAVLDDAIGAMMAAQRAPTTLASLKTMADALFGADTPPASSLVHVSGLTTDELIAALETNVAGLRASNARLILARNNADGRAQTAEATADALKTVNQTLVVERDNAIKRAQVAEGKAARLRLLPATGGGGGGGGTGGTGGTGGGTRTPLTDDARKVLVIQAEIKVLAAEIKALRTSGGAANAAKIESLTKKGKALYKKMDGLQVV